MKVMTPAEAAEWAEVIMMLVPDQIMGEIYRDGLRDHASARREFRRLYTDFTTSILRDDALWAEARLAKLDALAGRARRVSPRTGRGRAHQSRDGVGPCPLRSHRGRADSLG